MSTVANNSKKWFGEEYFRVSNEAREFFYCSVCCKSRRTHPYYHSKSEPRKHICKECYSGMVNEAVKKNKEEENKTIENVLNSKAFLPNDTIIYFGKPHLCGKEWSSKKYYCVDHPSKGVIAVPLLKCEKCGKLIAETGEVKNSLNHFRRINLKYAENIVVNPPKTQMVYGVSIKDFITRTTIARCSSIGHSIKDIQVSIKVWTRDYSVLEHIIPAIHCEDCGKYYILESEYGKLIKTGIPLCNIVEKDYWIKKDGKKYQLFLNEESILHKLGYNVNASINLPQNTRHQILEAVIVNGILSKAEVSSHLDYLKKRSKNNPSLRNAVSKWQDDREYVNGIASSLDEGKHIAKKITHSSYHYN